MIVVRHERWAIAIVSCILGFMVVTQYKMTQDNIEENIQLTTDWRFGGTIERGPE